MKSSEILLVSQTMRATAQRKQHIVMEYVLLISAFAIPQIQDEFWLCFGIVAYIRRVYYEN